MDHNQHIDKILLDLKTEQPTIFALLNSGSPAFEELVRMARIYDIEPHNGVDDIEHYEVYTEPNGNVIRVPRLLRSTLNKLREFSPGTRIKMMRLSAADMVDDINQQIAEDSAKAYALFTKKWVWKIDNEPVDFSEQTFNSDYIGVNLPGKKIKRLLKSRKMSAGDLKKVLDYFENPNREMKYKDRSGWVM